MSKIVKLSDGRTVNLDHIVMSKPDVNDPEKVKVILSNSAEWISINKDEYEKIISCQRDRNEDLCVAIRRLIEALDRLKVSIPSSIRMHL